MSANEKQMAYAKRKNAEGQFPQCRSPRVSKGVTSALDVTPLLTRGLLQRKASITSATAPDTRRTSVKLAASISPLRKASRQRIELNANAARANAVRAIILITNVSDIR